MLFHMSGLHPLASWCVYKDSNLKRLYIMAVYVYLPVVARWVADIDSFGRDVA